MTRTDYIFIVGMARTGSTLTRTILNSSQDIGIAGESHFFRDVPRLGLQARHSYRHKLTRIGDISTDSGAKDVVNYIFSSTKGFWNFRAKNISPDDFLQKLLESDRSERALLDLAMSFSADDKRIRGEKTPAHVYFVPTLLEWYPNAKIIHTFRDPRAIYVSNRKKSAKKDLPLHSAMFRKLGLSFEFYSSLNTILTWLRIVRLHHRYQQIYPDRYYLSRFEDLIVDPEISLRRLCDFLRVEFTECMLQQNVINSSYMPKGQMHGFDTSAITRWRGNLHPAINRWFILWCKQHLLEFGYQP